MPLVTPFAKNVFVKIEISSKIVILPLPKIMTGKTNSLNNLNQTLPKRKSTKYDTFITLENVSETA